MLRIPNDDGQLVTFIKENRGRPSPDLAPKVRTPLLVTDSKGFTLQNSLKASDPQLILPFLLWAEAGARAEKLVNTVKSRIDGALSVHGPIQLYFWAGTCDVTKKTGKKISLRNPEESSRTLSILSVQYRRLQAIVSDYPNITLKFLELPYITLSKWNHSDGADSLLADKQACNQIDSINLLIRQLNKDSNVNTVHFSRDCTKFRKRKGRAIKASVEISATSDGVHPSVHVSLKWIRKLQVDIFKTCHQDPDCLDIAVFSDELNLLEEDTKKAKSLS